MFTGIQNIHLIFTGKCGDGIDTDCGFASQVIV